MMVQCQRYTDELQSVWDGFIHDAAWNGTFLHTRQFLSYHGDKFEDVSLLVHDEGGRTIAVFPAAVHPVERETVVSHPGATFGGLVAGGQCRGESCISVLKDIVEYYRGMGFKRLLYKVTPHIYHQIPLQDDLYALFRLGFSRVRCDISATITANDRPSLTKGRKYEISKAKKCGVEVVEGLDYLKNIHELIEANLWQAHQAKPVHDVPELMLLHSRFPENVRFIAAKSDNEVVAGLIMFNFKNVAHTQYIASNERGREIGALDLLIEHGIKAAFADNYRYFDFGISNEQGGLVLNDGLYRYKRTFGAGSVVHEHYELDL
jgi:hypothetical protein